MTPPRSSSVPPPPMHASPQGMQTPPKQGRGQLSVPPSKAAPISPASSGGSRDQVTVYAHEGNPPNLSTATSLSDLTIDSMDDGSPGSRGRHADSSANTSAVSHTATFDPAEESPFEPCPGNDSVKVYQVEGTPINFSRSESLSSLSVFDEEGGMMLSPRQVVGRSSGQTPPEPEDRFVDGQSNSSNTQPGSRDSEDQPRQFAVEGTPVCFSRNSSLSSLACSDPEACAKKSRGGLDTSPKDHHKSYAVEGSPAVFSRQSSLSSLSVESTSFDPTPMEQALLEECISSAMPKGPRGNDGSRGSKQSTSRRSSTRTDDRMTKSSSVEMMAEPSSKPQGKDRGGKSEQEGKRMSRSCSASGDLDEAAGFDRDWESGTVRKLPQGGNKELKDSCNKELVEAEQRNGSRGTAQRLFRGPAQTTEAPVACDNRLLEETRNAAGDRRWPARDSGSSLEKVDSEKSEDEVTSSREEDTLMEGSGETQCNEVPPDEEGEEALEEEEEGRMSINISMESENPFYNDTADVTVLQGGRSGEEMSPEDEERLLEENASLIVSELASKQLMGGSGGEDMFLENETISLVSNDYTSDTASEVSVTWSVSSEVAGSEHSGSTLNPASPRPRIIKPGDGPVCKTPEPDDQGRSVRGRRKPLYKSPSTPGRTTTTTPSPTGASGRGRGTSRSPVTRQTSVPGKKTSPRSQSAGSTTNTKSSPGTATGPAKQPTPKPAAPKPRSSSASGIPTPGSKVSPATKTSGPAVKDNKATSAAKPRSSSVERPKPLVKQGTFTKDSASAMKAPVGPDEGSEGEVKMRKKEGRSSSQGDRNSGSSRGSGGSESWSKALNGFNFIVDTSQENGFDAPYKQILMQKNAKGSPIPNTATKTKSKTISSAASDSGLEERRSTTGSVKSSVASKNSLNKSLSGSNLKRPTTAPPKVPASAQSKTLPSNALKKQSSRGELRKSESSASLKKGGDNSRPTTPNGRRASGSQIPMKKSSPPTSSAKTPGTVGNKQVSSKIASLWRKEDVAKVSSTRSPPPPPPSKPASSAKKLTQKSRSLSASGSVGGVVEGMSKSSTYDKLYAETLDPPSSENELDSNRSQLGLADFSLDQSAQSASMDSLDDVSMHSEPPRVIDSSTFKKKRTTSFDAVSLPLPNADETLRGSVNSVSSLNRSLDSKSAGSVWRRYGDTQTLPADIWVKQEDMKPEQEKKEKKEGKKESKSFGKSLKSKLFGKKPFFGKSKDAAATTTTTTTTVAPTEKEATKEAGQKTVNLSTKTTTALKQEAKTSPSAIVPPFNYSPPASATKDAPTPNADTAASGSKTLAAMKQHATKTEMLIARRNQTALQKNVGEEESKRGCLVTTV